MDLRSKKSLDTWLGLPCLFVLSGLSRFKRSLFGAPVVATLPAATIVVAKFQGIGSVILAKPAIRRLRQAHPASRIVFWGTPSTVAIAREMPEFDDYVTLNDGTLVASLRSLLANLATLRGLRIDWFFDLEVYSKLSSLLAWLTPARHRAGFAVSSVRQRQTLHTHVVTFNRYEYVGNAYHRLLGLLGGDDTASVPDFGPWRAPLVPLSQLPHLANRRYIVVNLHASELSLERKWPRESFVAYVEELLKLDATLHVVLVGHGRAEAAECALVPRHERIIDLSNTLRLDETLLAVGGAALVVSNDSAPLHMAIALKVPALGLFGPTRRESFVPADRPRTSGLTKNLYCSPCVHHWEPPSCGGNNVCMKTITVREVIDETCRLLGIATPTYPLREPTYDLGNFRAGVVVTDS